MCLRPAVPVSLWVEGEGAVAEQVPGVGLLATGGLFADVGPFGLDAGVGGEQVRTVRFENGLMVLAPPRRLYAGVMQHQELTWERIAA